MSGIGGMKAMTSLTGLPGLVVRRLVEFVPTVLVIVVASFALVRLAPGSPFSSEREIPPEIRRQLDAKYGFDRPLPEQFLRYVGNLARGDLGLSTSRRTRARSSGC